MEYTVKLTNAENLAFSYIALSQQEWIDNAVKERCRLAIEEIVKIAVEKCLQENIQIPGTKEEIVTLAFSKNWIESAKDRTDKAEQNKI